MKQLVQKLDTRLTAALPVLVFALFVLQPLMDILSFWVTELEWSNTLTLLLRMGVLALMCLTGFFLSKRKWIYLVTAAVAVVLAAGHIFAMYQYGITDLVGDLTNLVRVWQMPLTAICLITFLRRNERSYEGMKWGMTACLLLTLAVEVLAVLTHTEPHTYMDGKGYMGWFNNTNSQSNNLCMLLPVAMVCTYAKKGWKSPLFWLVTLGGFTAMYFMGPRLSYLGIAASGLGLGISAVLINVRNWKKLVVLTLIVLLFVSLMPLSPMVAHQKIYEQVQSDRQNGINAQLEEWDLPPLDEPGISEEELRRRQDLWVQALTPIYEFYAPDFVEIFGARKTIELHNYTYNILDITGLRPKKLKFAQLLMNDSPVSAQYFGLELSRFTVGENIYDVENDFHGIYYLYGWTGLTAMLAFLGYFIWLILRALTKSAKTYFTFDAAAWGIGLVMCLIHVYCTAGVLRRPNASFFLAAALAAVYYLVNLKKYDTPTLNQ